MQRYWAFLESQHEYFKQFLIRAQKGIATVNFSRQELTEIGRKAQSLNKSGVNG